ncbi:unnamed protein product [Urochloa decumbens]|uniref:Knottins-like domain-containing protein n=1 Tax=Urochloa decumbens TaxID=240449 RepID=A0ABC9AZB9_9POAL
MEPSQRKKKNLFAATPIVVLLVILTAEMASVEGNTCRHLSGSYRGWCLNDYGCQHTCFNENFENNFSGECHDFPPRCYCYSTDCPP